MSSTPSQPSDDLIDWPLLYRDFGRYVNQNSEIWFEIAMSVSFANLQDCEDGYQQAVAKLWKRIEAHVQLGDGGIEAPMMRALSHGCNPAAWMAKVLRGEVTEVVRRMYKVRAKKASDTQPVPKHGTEAKEDLQSRRRQVQMKDEHLATLEPVQPDTTSEETDAQADFIEKILGRLSEDEIAALNAKCAVKAKTTMWAEVAAQIGESVSALKQRASRASRKLRTQLAKLGFKKLADI